MTAQAAMQAKVAKCSTGLLKEMAEKLFADMRAEADTVMRFVLNELEGRMPEAEFVSFCEAL